MIILHIFELVVMFAAFITSLFIFAYFMATAIYPRFSFEDLLVCGLAYVVAVLLAGEIAVKLSSNFWGIPS